MIIVCEKCDRRFHLADGRIPAKGARVRCSKCHHRFHVMPGGTPDEPDAAEHSAPPPSPAGSHEEPDLDNPEFLFDEPSADEPVALAPEAEPLTLARGPIAPETPPARPEPSPVPPPTPEAEAASPEFEIEGNEIAGTAERDLDALEEPGGGEPETPAPAEGAAAPEAEPFPAADDPTGDEPSIDTSTDSEALLGEDDTDSSFPSLSKVDPPSDEIDDVISAFEDDDTLGGWDPLESPPTAPPASADAGATVFEHPEIPQAPEREAPRPFAPDADPDLSRSTSVVLPALALLVGIGLVVGGARLSLLYSFAPPSGPQSVVGAGWTARDVESFHLRDASGRRVLVVRGRLRGRGLPPRVEVQLLDAAERPVGNPVVAALARFAAPDLTPEALDLRFAAEPGPQAQPEAFTALVWEPAGRARRFALALSAGRRPPHKSAQPSTPPPAPVPAESPPSLPAAPAAD